MVPRFVRNLGAKAVKADIAAFLNEHEEEFLQEVRHKLDELDKKTPDEKAYIDIKMEQLGEDVARAILEAIRSFLHKI